MAIETLLSVPPPPLGVPRQQFDIEALYVAVDRARRERRLSWRGVLRDAGIPGLGLITRLAHGKPPDVHNLVRLLVWLGNTDIKPYITEVAQ